MTELKETQKTNKEVSFAGNKTGVKMNKPYAQVFIDQMTAAGHIPIINSRGDNWYTEKDHDNYIGWCVAKDHYDVEITKLKQKLAAIHDRILRGDSDHELLSIIDA